MKNLVRLVAIVGVAGSSLLVACDSDAPGLTSGVVTATLVSPNGPEGAAHLKLFGEGITEVRTLDARTFSYTLGDTVNVVVVRDQPGDLRFLVALADTTRVPSVSIAEVAGGDDELRPSVQGYRVEMRP
jgi:hypothetical protein